MEFALSFDSTHLSILTSISLFVHPNWRDFIHILLPIRPILEVVLPLRLPSEPRCQRRNPQHRHRRQCIKFQHLVVGSRSAPRNRQHLREYDQNGNHIRRPHYGFAILHDVPCIGDQDQENWHLRSKTDAPVRCFGEGVSSRSTHPAVIAHTNATNAGNKRSFSRTKSHDTIVMSRKKQRDMGRFEAMKYLPGRC